MTGIYKNYRQLDRELKDGKIYPVYFFYGENDYLIREYEGRIVKKVVGEGGVSGDLGYSIFYGGDDRVEGVLGTAATIPMLGERRVVVLRYAENLKDKDVKRLTGYLDAPSDRTALIITARGVGKGKVKGTNMARPPGKLGALVVLSMVAVFGKEREGEIRNRIKEKFKGEGKEIDAEALDIIIDFLGRDQSAISREVEKILIYMGDEKRATMEDVEAMVPYLRVHSVYEMTDALSLGEEGRAINIIREILSGGTEPIAILPIIRWHFMRLWSLRVLYDDGLEVARIATRLNIPKFKISDYIEQAKRISNDVFRDIFQVLYDTDRFLKTRSGSGVKNGIIMDKMALDITEMMR